MLRIAINGYGRIGRAVLRAIVQNGLEDRVQVVAINDLGSPETLAHLTHFDSTYGRFPGEVRLENNTLYAGKQVIRVVQEREPTQLPWAELGVDMVFECTGKLKKRELAAQHLEAGAGRVLMSHPLDTADLTVVYGVNDELLNAEQRIVSNGSCTTNCLAPLAKALHEGVGIRQGLINTVHAYTNDQNLLDQNHKDLYRARAAALSIIPTSTGAAKTIGLVLPELTGRLDGLAVRVPTPTVSLLDLTFTAEQATSVAAINALLEAAASQSPVMECNSLPLVSSDFTAYPASCIVDLTQTRVQGDLVKVLAWYDNEWAFTLRMLDVAQHWHALGNAQ